MEIKIDLWPPDNEAIENKKAALNGYKTDTFAAHKNPATRYFNAGPGRDPDL